MSSHPCFVTDISDGPCGDCENERDEMKLPKPTGEKCPDCKDGYLVERMNGKTTNTFLGCNEWPDCKYTKNGGVNPSPAKAYSSTWEDDYYEDDGYDDNDIMREGDY